MKTYHPLLTINRARRKKHTYLEMRDYLRSRLAREVSTAPKYARAALVANYALLINTAFPDAPAERDENIARRNRSIAREYPYVAG